MEHISSTPSQLGQALRQHRKARGWTQTEVADAVGLLPKTISGLESVPDRSQVGSLLKLISALVLELVLRPKPAPDGRSPTSEW
jgi:HTH-type transcriptional regulator/antitoxin HipB